METNYCETVNNIKEKQNFRKQNNPKNCIIIQYALNSEDIKGTEILTEEQAIVKTAKSEK